MAKTIMIVDDDPGLRESLAQLLELEGYPAVEAHDGQDALDKILSPVPALILLDIMMPRMNGYLFAEELERRGLRREIPIIVLTADGRAREKARQIGADDYLEKPFEIDLLLDKVARFLGPQV